MSTGSFGSTALLVLVSSTTDRAPKQTLLSLDPRAADAANAASSVVLCGWQMAFNALPPQCMLLAPSGCEAALCPTTTPHTPPYTPSLAPASQCQQALVFGSPSGRWERYILHWSRSAYFTHSTTPTTTCASCPLRSI